MKDSNELILGNIIKLTRSSEKKFKQGNFKGAIDDKMKANAIMKSKSCDEKIIEKYREELSRLYSSKFDLFFDHKHSGTVSSSPTESSWLLRPSWPSSP